MSYFKLGVIRAERSAAARLQENERTASAPMIEGPITCASCEYRYLRNAGVCVMCGTPAPALEPVPAAACTQPKVSQLELAGLRVRTWMKKRIQEQIRAGLQVVAMGRDFAERSAASVLFTLYQFSQPRQDLANHSIPAFTGVADSPELDARLSPLPPQETELVPDFLATAPVSPSPDNEPQSMEGTWLTLRSAAPAAALLIPAVILALTTVRYHPSSTAAASPAPRASATLQPAHLGASAITPFPASSHAQVTDRATSSALHALSPYEIPTLQRQAHYGDDSAAFLLGMAYEIGQGVPRSCVTAAQWVATSANWGNAAAQYNLGLRYRDGDGVAVNQRESQKWISKAVAQNYSKARLAPTQPAHNTR